MNKEKPASNGKPAAGLPRPATVHLQIGPDGEISAWGLEKELEAMILERTGNEELYRQRQNMSYNLCG